MKNILFSFNIMNRVNLFVKKNWPYIATVVLLILFIFSVSTEGFASELAEYPKIFTDSIMKPFVSEIQTSELFKSTFEPQPYMPPISQLNIESQIQSVMIDIGNGKAVSAPVQIPAQVIENIQTQKIIKYEEPKETDVLVAAQVVQLPEQEGTIKAEVNGNGDFIQVPVVVPAQTVVIPEQKAVETTMETFRI